MWFCFQKRAGPFEPPRCVFRAARLSPNAAVRKQQTSLHHFLSVPSHTPNWFASFIFYLMTRRCQGDATVEVLIMHCGFWSFVVFPPQKKIKPHVCAEEVVCSRLRLRPEFKREHEKGRTANRKSAQGSRNSRVALINHSFVATMMMWND